MKPVRIIADSKYPNMFRLEWENGDLSRWPYNLTRAKDILRNYDKYIAAMATSARQEGQRRPLGR